jgi:hypothetical protein
MIPLKHRFALVLVAYCICRASAQDVSSIIDQIQTEQKSPSEASPTPRPAKPPKKAKRASSGQGAVDQFWGPKDKLPGNIAGKYLIGDFKVLGASINGHALLVAEDGLFGRSFEVDNLNTGLAPGQSYPSGQEPRLRFTRNDPLVFIERGVLGCYTVRSTHAVQIPQGGSAYGGGYYNQGVYGQPYTTPTYRAGWGVSPN